MNIQPRTLEFKFHAHCAHCGEEMRIEMDKTIGVTDDHFHWLITPCECQFVVKDDQQAQSNA